MTTSQETFILNDFTGSTFDRRIRNGKSRYTVTIKAEPLAINLSPTRLGEGPANAIRDVLRDSIKRIGWFAATATRDRRERAAREFSVGKPSAVRRYTGGRTGATPPNQTQRAYNDSGRLADNLAVRQNEERDWIINVVANRFDPSTFTPAAFDRMITRLIELAPEWSGGRALLSHESVVLAIKKGLDESFVRVGEARNKASKAWWGAAQKIFSSAIKPVLLG